MLVAVAAFELNDSGDRVLDIGEEGAYLSSYARPSDALLTQLALLPDQLRVRRGSAFEYDSYRQGPIRYASCQPPLDRVLSHVVVNAVGIRGRSPATPKP